VYSPTGFSSIHVNRRIANAKAVLAMEQKDIAASAGEWANAVGDYTHPTHWQAIVHPFGFFPCREHPSCFLSA